VIRCLSILFITSKFETKFVEKFRIFYIEKRVIISNYIKR